MSDGWTLLQRSPRFSIVFWIGSSMVWKTYEFKSSEAKFRNFASLDLNSQACFSTASEQQILEYSNHTQQNVVFDILPKALRLPHGPPITLGRIVRRFDLSIPGSALTIFRQVLTVQTTVVPPLGVFWFHRRMVKVRILTFAQRSLGRVQ